MTCNNPVCFCDVVETAMKVEKERMICLSVMDVKPAYGGQRIAIRICDEYDSYMYTMMLPLNKADDLIKELQACLDELKE